MSIGYWGDFEFTVSRNKIYTFNGFGRKAAIQVDDQELEGEKPSTYIKGVDLESIGINIDLKSSMGVDVKAEIERWRAALYAKTARAFVIGDKPLSSKKWLLLRADESDGVFDSAGNYISAKLALSFKEFARGGSKDFAEKKKAKGATEGGVIDKLDGSRYNPNAEQSKTKTNSQGTFTYDSSGKLISGTKKATVLIAVPKSKWNTGGAI